MSKKINIYSFISDSSSEQLSPYMDPENRALIRKDPHKYAVEKGLTVPNAPTDNIEVKVVTCKADLTYIPLWDANLSYEITDLKNIQAAGEAPLSTLGSVSSLLCLCGTLSSYSSAGSFSSVDAS